ncbi:MAG: PEP-CTERM sorting domain-containing protein [Capsulimonadales bacterium]|nr:PEP-CTERM sorting domain-containing protein [Capsulimonadales bacterium]
MQTKRFLPGIILALLTATAPTFAQETIGAALISRPVLDSSVPLVIALHDGFTQPGTLTTWAFFNDISVGGSVIPLLLTKSGADFIVSGVGTQRSNSGAGLQSFAFGLTSGSASVTSGTLFGWWQDIGVVPLDFVAPSSSGNNTTVTVGTDPLNLFAGANLGSGVQVLNGGNTRDYSIQATAIFSSSAAPEPGTIVLLGIGLVGAIAARRRNV